MNINAVDDDDVQSQGAPALIDIDVEPIDNEHIDRRTKCIALLDNVL